VKVTTIILLQLQSFCNTLLNLSYRATSKIQNNNS